MSKEPVIKHILYTSKNYRAVKKLIVDTVDKDRLSFVKMRKGKIIVRIFNPPYGYSRDDYILYENYYIIISNGGYFNNSRMNSTITMESKKEMPDLIKKGIY